MRDLIIRFLSLVPLGKRERNTEAARPEPEDPGSRKPPSFRSVELRTRSVACRAAKALAGKRILVAEAPALPLQGCALRCTCHYKPHPDRRDSEPRRAADVGVSGAYYVGPERRSGRDRRSRDRGPDDDYYGYLRRRDQP